MTKNQTIDLLRNQLPGFYSVEQVINLIEKIEEEKTASISSEQIELITNKILEAIDEEHNLGNIVNAEDIELDFNNWDRKITIGDVPINLNVIRDCVEEELTNSLEEKEEEEEEND
jgi:hypothetical protein